MSSCLRIRVAPCTSSCAPRVGATRGRLPSRAIAGSSAIATEGVGGSSFTSWYKPRARRHRNAGTYGNDGNVVTVSCRIHRR
jgi:hypothetical protein